MTYRTNFSEHFRKDTLNKKILNISVSDSAQKYTIATTNTTASSKQSVLRITETNNLKKLKKHVMDEVESQEHGISSEFNKTFEMESQLLQLPSETLELATSLVNSPKSPEFAESNSVVGNQPASSLVSLAVSPAVASSAVSGGNTLLSVLGGVLGVGTVFATAGGAGTVTKITEPTPSPAPTPTPEPVEQEYAPQNSTIKNIASPIALDLNGDGVQYTASEQGVPFDVTGTGMMQPVQWIDSHDGYLVFDNNKDGIITGLQELAFSFESEFWANLTQIDSNGNGSIDNSDEVFHDLSIWVDANTNGTVEQGELKSVEDFGIQSFNLDLHNVQNLIETATTTELTTTLVQESLKSIITYSTENGQIHDALFTCLNIEQAQPKFIECLDEVLDQLDPIGGSIPQIENTSAALIQNILDIAMQNMNQTH